MKNLLSITFAAIFLFSLNGFAQGPKQGGWDLLGSRVVNWGIDKDIIAVGPNTGGYTKLKIKVTGGSINMHRMVVTYGNGEKDEIPLKHNFMKGDDSRLIDLKGGKRQIKTITFWYDTKNGSGKKATIHVAGKKG
ncbi:MAG: DUF2541 family protein [Crocinitomicaceae bacterium]